jgi:hypothetical protein
MASLVEIAHFAIIMIAWLLAIAAIVLAAAAAIVLAFFITTACHEIGHVLSGRAMSLPIRRCEIGQGRVLLRWRWFGIPFELRQRSPGGCTHGYPILRVRKLSLILFVIGGVLGNLVLLASVMALDAAGVLSRIGFDGRYFFLLLAAWQAISVVTNLLPLPPRPPRRPIGSDGWQLLKLLPLPRQQVTELGKSYLASLRNYTPSAAESAIDSAEAPFIVSWQSRPHPSVDRDAYDELEHRLDRLLEAGALSPAEEMLVLDGRLTAGVISSDLYPLARLDEWSRRLVELGPTIEASIETRASVLIQLGRHAEGREMLDRLGVGSQNYVGVLRRLFLAQAEHGLGNLAVARQLLADAQHIADALQVTQAVHPLTTRLAVQIAEDDEISMATVAASPSEAETLVAT